MSDDRPHYHHLGAEAEAAAASQSPSDGQILADLRTQVSRLRVAALAVLDRYKSENFMRTADLHSANCQCKRCEFDRLDAVIGEMAED